MTAVHRRSRSASSDAICSANATRSECIGGSSGGRAASRGAQAFAAPRDLLLEDVFLAREVPVEGPDRDLRFGRDVVDGDLVEAPLPRRVSSAMDSNSEIIISERFVLSREDSDSVPGPSPCACFLERGRAGRVGDGCVRYFAILELAAAFWSSTTSRLRRKPPLNAFCAA